MTIGYLQRILICFQLDCSLDLPDAQRVSWKVCEVTEKEKGGVDDIDGKGGTDNNVLGQTSTKGDTTSDEENIEEVPESE